MDEDQRDSKMTCPICEELLTYLGHGLFMCQLCGAKFHMCIEEIKVYDRALTTEEIQRLVAEREVSE